jgi:hypothetical protein
MTPPQDENRARVSVPPPAPAAIEALKPIVADALHSVRFAHDDSGNVYGHVGDLVEQIATQLAARVPLAESRTIDAALARARTNLSFFASVIKSGESWTLACENEMEQTFAALDEARVSVPPPAPAEEPFAIPDRVAFDARGFGWRVWNDQEAWSMVPTTDDNLPIPEPITWFVPESFGHRYWQRIAQDEAARVPLAESRTPDELVEMVREYVTGHRAATFYDRVKKWLAEYDAAPSSGAVVAESRTIDALRQLVDACDDCVDPHGYAHAIMVEDIERARKIVAEYDAVRSQPGAPD